jgi:three-Cys-motif partner protein
VPDTHQLTQEFFESRQAAAVLKHAILTSYLPVWAGKTGSTSLDHRVAVGDCYAGAGRYRDGSPGSPAIIAQLAQQPGLRNRRIEAYFIEQDPATFEQLREVLEADATGISWEAWQGGADGHLDQLIARTQGVPLFLFLDPYGHGLSCDRLMTALAARPSDRWSPPTEALIRIDSAAVFRTRGALRKAPYPGRDRTLSRLDETAGGSWWRDEDDPALTTDAHLDWFAAQVLRRLSKQWRWAGWAVPVRRKAGTLPVYYLIFLTRHVDGMTVFNDSLSLATAQWRRRIFDLSVEGSLFEGDVGDDTFASQEAELEQEWCLRLKENMIALLAERPSFVVVREMERVFAGVLGLAREKHLRAALRQLNQEGVTASDSKGHLYEKLVTATSPEPTGRT